MVPDEAPPIFVQFVIILALICSRRGDTETAMKYVNELPSLYCGREIMAEKILYGVNSKQAIKKIAQI